MHSFIIVMLGVLMSCIGHYNAADGQFISNIRAGAKEMTWWKDTIIYQIYPRSFKDFDGDGVGDLKGIESELDYLVNLNVGGVWISPIYKSPMKDFGYDISDFRDIDPIFGSLDDFKSLVSSAHSKGLKIIMDFVPNHSSNEHEWFQKSVRKEDPYTDYYVWVDPIGYDENGDPIPPCNWVSHFRGSAWQYVEERRQFYLHQYLPEQPDLNYRNPKVMEEMKDVLKFWLDLGVDGFREDAVVTLWEDNRWLDEPPSNDPNAADEEDWLFYDHIYTINLPQTRVILSEFYNTVKSYGSEKLIVLEANVPNTADYTDYYNCSDFLFNFKFPTNWSTPGNNTPPYPLNAYEVKQQMDKWIKETPDNKISNWVLGNHDTSRVANRYGNKFIDMLNIMVLTLPGTVVTYQGEEIGMSDNQNISFIETQDPRGCNCGLERYKECSRDPERTPFQWHSRDNTAGFSTNSSADTWLPINSNFQKCDYQKSENECGINVEDENQIIDSHLDYYTQISRAKSERMFEGDFLSEVKMEDVLVFARCRFPSIQLGPCSVTMANLGDKMLSVDIYLDFDTFAEQGLVLTSTMRESNPPDSIVDLKNVSLEAYETIVLLLA